MRWERAEIIDESGRPFEAQAPVIVSASRATDIPAFYTDWLLERLKRGYCKWINPFNGKPSYVSFSKTRVIVFWSKNPKPLMRHLDEISESVPNFYFQFTLNDYDNENFEEHVPPLEKRIETFRQLSSSLGSKKVIWRFDPILITKDLDIPGILERIRRIGDELHGYTDKLVFSYADIGSYRKVKNNLTKESVPYIEFDEGSMKEVAQGLARLNEEWGYTLATCTEKIDLEEYGIEHNRCIDDRLMVELFREDRELMEFLGVPPRGLFDDTGDEWKYIKDKGQRKECGCFVSKDIGQYNTCPHGCNYCYANTSKDIMPPKI